MKTALLLVLILTAAQAKATVDEAPAPDPYANFQTAVAQVKAAASADCEGRLLPDTPA